MRKNFINESRFGVLFCLAVLGCLAALIILPNHFRSNAGKQEKNIEKSKIQQEKIENYDIRTDKRAFEKITQFRQAQGKGAAEIADSREEFVRGEEELKARVPTLKVEYSANLRTPEVIAPDIKQGRTFLTESSGLKHPEILRRFAKENNNLLGATDGQLDGLKVSADYSNPDGNLSFTRLEQFIDDVPVFQGEIKAGFTKDGRVIRVINNLAPNLDYQSLSSDFRNPLDAVKAAARLINYDLPEAELTINEAESKDTIAVFGKGDWATTAEKMYFPTEPGVAVPAWRVLIWQPADAYYVIVDAATGTLLWRKNIMADQTQPATYNIYANPNAMINVADNPAPMTPGPVSPSTGSQGAIINRTSVTLVGNESPYTFNNNGWITNGNNSTDGNAVEAGLDRVSPNGVDEPVQGSAFRDFTFNYNPAPGNPAPGDSPLGAESQKGSVTQLFYILNRYHDELYRLGFTEQAGNFQNDNFGRGGLGNDRVSAQSQDNFCPNSTGCANNANFATPSDGFRGRMQMFLWTTPSPNRDGALDADIVIHEMTHGLSSRLHGDASGLSSNMAGGMGEGWSDFYAHCLLSEPTDPLDGVYSSGGYSTNQIFSGFAGNYYYGIRRFPKAIMSSTGGPNNRPHNPLTFADIDSTQANIADGAFPRGPIGVPNLDGVHNIGEVWSSALWEVRAKFITRLGGETGNRRILQYVTDGMKLSPSAPDFIQSRDAIIAAAQASLPTPQANADVVDIWEGFRIRGIGFSASVTSPGSGNNNTRVVEAFNSPNLFQTPTFTFSDAVGDNDGFAEPGEILTVTIPLFNNTGLNAENTTLQVVGGGSANYGTIINNTTVSRTVSYTVPANTVCGSLITLTFNVNNSLGTATFTRQIFVGVPNLLVSENFDGTAAPNLPAGWVSSVPNPPNPNAGLQWITTVNTPASAPNAAFNSERLTPSLSDLESPVVTPTVANAQLKFDIRYNTESSFDGAVLEIRIGDGNYQDILTAGGSFVTGGYNSDFATNSDNPIKGRPAWTGNSGGYVTALVNLPASAAGQPVKFRWRNASDTAVAVEGVFIDNVQIINGYTCSVSPGTVKSRADYDGDGKTDLSVFRPSEGVWYLNRSTDGFTAVGFGLMNDTLVPGDYDGDNKTDVAVFRNGSWFILNSSNSTFQAVSWGLGSDLPTAGDFDGDGRTDTAVFRPSDGVWYVINSGGGTQFTQFGLNGDIPVPGDFDGDGKTDLGVYRDGVWFLLQSTAGFQEVAFGLGTDNPVPADYDGDNKDDIAVFRPTDGIWYRLNSTNGQFAAVQFGQAGDIPVPGDYDGDGRDDQAVYRAGIWFLLQSTSGFAGPEFGVVSDKPIPKSYIP